LSRSQSFTYVAQNSRKSIENCIIFIESTKDTALVMPLRPELQSLAGTVKSGAIHAKRDSFKRRV